LPPLISWISFSAHLTSIVTQLSCLRPVLCVIHYPVNILLVLICNCFRGCCARWFGFSVGAGPLDMIWEERTMGTANERDTEVAEVGSWSPCKISAGGSLSHDGAWMAGGVGLLVVASAALLEPALCRPMWLPCMNWRNIITTRDYCDI
jgi:hypothetical protein